MALTTAGTLCDYADLKGEDQASFLKVLGATAATRTVILASIPVVTWDAAVKKWRIGNGVSTEEEPSMVQQATAGYVGTLARQAAGIETIQQLKEELAKAKAAPTSSTTSTTSTGIGLIKLSSVVDQGSAADREVQPMTEEEMDAYYRAYRDKMGHDPRPEEDITLEQLTGLRALFRSGVAPYVDLSIWGPFGARTQRKLKMAGLNIGADGVLTQVQVPGPPNVESWLEGFGVFRTGCIMLGEVSIATLGMWMQMVVDYSARYGANAWPLIYQAEVRARS